MIIDTCAINMYFYHGCTTVSGVQIILTVYIAHVSPLTCAY